LTWTIEWDDRARKDLRKLDVAIQKKILAYLRMRVTQAKDPRIFGHGLTGNRAGLWRFRVEDYRLICKIEHHILIVFVVRVGHRKEIYEG